MAQEWYYAKDGKQLGPVPEQVVRQMVATGALLGSDLVWHEGLADWLPAAKVPGLVPPQSPAAPPVAGGGNPPSQASPSPPGEAADIHPLVALALAIGTLGLFSVWYAWRTSVHYAAASGDREFDSTGRALGPVRHPAWVLIASYLTLGVYFCYWVYTAMHDCARFTGQHSSPRKELTLMLIFPPYAVYSVIFKLPAMIAEARKAAGLSETPLEPLHAFLNPLMFPGLPFLAVLYQDRLNEVWRSAK